MPKLCQILQEIPCRCILKLCLKMSALIAWCGWVVFEVHIWTKLKTSKSMILVFFQTISYIAPSLCSKLYVVINNYLQLKIALTFLVWYFRLKTLWHCVWLYELADLLIKPTLNLQTAESSIFFTVWKETKNFKDHTI